MENMAAWAAGRIESLGGEAALRKALSAGGDMADLFFEEVATASLVLEDGRLEKILSGEEAGVGLRTVFGDHQALASTSEPSRAALMDLAGTLSQAVKRGEPGLSAAAGRPGVGPRDKARVRPDTVGLEAKVDLVRRAEAAARGYDGRIRQVRVTYGDRAQVVVILNSEGVFRADERISTLFMVQVVAADGGVVQVGYESVGGALGFELFEEHPPETVALKAAGRAILMLEAEEAPGGPMPVVLSAEAGGTMIHEAVGHGLEADLAGEGLSVYTGRLGEEVASPLITVLDDATLPYRRGSFTFDDEGAPAQRTVLIEKGVLKTYMHDWRSARKAGLGSTGNGRRMSFRHPPIVRMTNTLIAPGKTDPKDILAATDRGLFVRKMGGGQVNTVNGDFVFEVSEGYLIDRGRLGPAVRGATLTGQGPEILRQIDRVGSDLGFAIGTCGKDGQGAPVADAQPTIRLPEIIVGGRKV
jgi:TldD protein